MAPGIAGVLPALFTANVAAGAASGSAFPGDVGEMLLPFGAAIALVAAILSREDAAG